MNDDFEGLLRRWLHDRGRPDRETLERFAGHVAVLPPRRRRPARILTRAAAVVLTLAIGAVLIGRSGITDVGGPPGGPTPPDPAAFTGDPRLERCGGATGEVLFAFEMARARDFWLHFPAALQAPELEVDDPAFVAVFRDLHPGGVTGAPPPPGQTWAPRSPTPGLHDLCVLIGADPETAALNIYVGVSLDGFAAVLDSMGSVPPPSVVSVVPDVPSTVTPWPSVTPGPAPSWAVDLAAQLQCDGPVSWMGNELGDSSGRYAGTTPEGAIQGLLEEAFYFTLPRTSYRATDRETHWVRFAHEVEGRVKLVLAVTDEPPQGAIVTLGWWAVVGLRSCDPSEFDLAVELSGERTLWLDADGQRVSSEIVSSAAGPGHCGWESTIWLRFGGQLYIRDPEGLLEGSTEGSFAAGVELPAGATTTGYRSGRLELWTAPGESAVFVVTTDGVERWPRADPSLGCA